MPNPPVDPALEERVARAIYASWFAVTVRDTDIPDRLPDGFGPVAKRVLAALTTDDLKALLQARSDEVVVTLDREAAEEGVAALRAGLSHTPSTDDDPADEECPACRFVLLLSTALDREVERDK